jgi:hypothetical protein
MAATQSSGYQSGQRPGAAHVGGASSAATPASAGATQGGMPRRAPSTARPADAPASSTDVAARQTVISHASQSAIETPAGGG